MSLELLMIFPMLPHVHSSIISTPLPRRLPPEGLPCPAYLWNLVFEVCQSSGCRLPFGRGCRIAACGTNGSRRRAFSFPSRLQVIRVALFSYLVYFLQKVLRVSTVSPVMPSLSFLVSAPWVGGHHKSVSDLSGPAGLEGCDLFPQFPVSGFPPYPLRYPFPVAVRFFPGSRPFSGSFGRVTLPPPFFLCLVCHSLLRFS